MAFGINGFWVGSGFEEEYYDIEAAITGCLDNWGVSILERIQVVKIVDWAVGWIPTGPDSLGS